MTFDRGRNFDGGGIGMRNRQDDNDRRVVRWTLDPQHEYAWAILASFFPSGFVFVMPEIGIGNDETRFGRRDWHASGYFGSSSSSRCACRLSMREARISWTLSRIVRPSRSCGDAP